MHQVVQVYCDCGDGPFRSDIGLRIHKGHKHNTNVHRGRQPARARRVFLAHNGPGPWPCGTCKELVYELGKGAGKGHIHHKDDDRSNDTPVNLEVLHGKCHMRHHLADVPHSAEHNAKVGRKGRIFTSEWKAKLRARQLERRTCEKCGYTSSPQCVGKHIKANTCTQL